MKLYRVIWIDDDLPERHQHQWMGTQADCRALEKSLRSEMMLSIKTIGVDVPTDKPGLLKWLNTP